MSLAHGVNIGGNRYVGTNFAKFMATEKKMSYWHKKYCAQIGRGKRI